MANENQDINGFLNVYKEKGMTSFDVCRKVKRIFNTQKVGHSGTLDPNATGVMQIALGRATKLLPIIEDHKKVYEATVLFGVYTETLDPEGAIIKEEDTHLTLEEIDDKLQVISLMTEQIPPIYSAIKVNGKKLYEYARKGETVEIKSRPAKIFNYKRTTDIFMVGNHQAIKVELEVSKGFYVRSFVRDLADLLNTFAIMSDLVRIQIENFNIKDSKKLDEISIKDLISIEDAFAYLPKYECKDYLVKLIKNGASLDERQIVINEPFRVYNNGKILAIYAPFEENKYKIIQYLGE